MTKLLLPEPPLQVLPSLATAIGLNEAIFLQQLHYWLLKSNHIYDDHVWIYNTYEGWKEQFPFWSIPTIRRVINNLRNMDLIIATNEYNQRSFDNTLWYTIRYDVLSSVEISRRSDQNDQMERSNRSDHVIKMITPIPENTTENSNRGGVVPSIWDRVLQELRSRTPDATFDLFIANAKLLEISKEKAVIAIPDSKAKDWLQNRLSTQLRRLLSQEMGYQVKSIEIVVE